MQQTEDVSLLIAGFPILLRFFPIRDYVYEKKLFKKNILKYLQGFRSTEPLDKHTTINIIDREKYQIVFNRKTSFAELAFYKNAHTIEIQYQVSIAQFLMTLSNLITALLHQNSGLVLHASACIIDRKAHVFIGQSGAGKSTIVRMLRKKYHILADDLLYLKKIKKDYVAYQTANIEKVRWISKTNESYPLGGIYLLRQATRTRIDTLDTQIAFQKILSNTMFIPKQKASIINTLFNLTSTNPRTYLLHFNLDQQSVIHTLEQGT